MKIKGHKFVAAMFEEICYNVASFKHHDNFYPMKIIVTNIQYYQTMCILIIYFNKWIQCL
jgi:hypothetical protein